MSEEDEGRLPQSLSVAETWSFGVTMFLFWAYSAQSALVAIGPASLAVWTAVAADSAVFNLQVRRLALTWPGLVGGSASYVARLFADRPLIGRYAAMAYFVSWATVPPIAAIFLTGIVGSHFAELDSGPAHDVLVVALTVVPFVVAWSGIRAVALLQLLYAVPVVAILVAFIASGLGWIGFASDSPGFLPVGRASPQLVDLAKVFFLLTFSAFGGESAAVFTGESRAPRGTIRSLVLLAVVAIPFYVGASFVLLQASPARPDDDIQAGFLTVAGHLWGGAAPFVGSLFLAGVALLGATAAVAIAPRVLYQQARDGRLPEVFGVASARGVPGPALVATLVVGVVFALSLDLADGLIASTACWFAFWILLHTALWHARGRPEVLWPRLALLLGVSETLVFVVGGIALGILPVLAGLALPALGLVAAAALGRVPASAARVLQAEWWRERYRPRPLHDSDGGIARHVVTIVVLISAAIVVIWFLAADVERDHDADAAGIVLASALLIAGFFAVAVAGSTTLAHLAALSAARLRAESTALDLERERAAQEAANRDLERINRAQRDFVSIVSHEFRTPLTGIQGFAEIIRDEEISVAETKEFADDIHRDAVRLSRMIGEILDLERMRSGRMTLERAPLDLGALVRGVTDRMGAQAPDHPIILQLGELPPFAGDADKLTQVFTNLLSNAIKYSPRGGPITVSCGLVHGGIEVAVLDNGIGIPADQLDAVFDPYIRIESAAAKNVQGTGLGLPITREIVRLHGGRVWAEAGPAGGTVFRVRLPLPAGADGVDASDIRAGSSG